MPSRETISSCNTKMFAALLTCAALAACAETAAPGHVRPAGAAFLVVPLWPDTVGICLGANSPSGTYSFSWVIQNGQPGDIHDVTSPTSQTMSPGECLAPWRRETPLPDGVFVDVIVTETGTPPGVALDSVELQDHYGDRVSFTATDTVQASATTGGALTFYHEPVSAKIKVPLLLGLGPLPGPDPSTAFGEMTIVLDPFTPPNPCGPVPAPSATAVALCGHINNPGGETFTGGELSIGGTSLPVAMDAFPPSPCRNYVIQGAVGVPAGLLTQAANDPGGVTLRFDSREHPNGAIGGSPAGSAAPSVSQGLGAPSSSSPEPGACLVRFGP